MAESPIFFSTDPRPEPPPFGEETLPRAHMNGHAAKPVSELPPLGGIVNHLEWTDEQPQPRQWVVDGIIPAGTVTLFQGDGGLGKSLLTIQLMYACATGRPWLGQKTRPCRTFAVYCEDEEEELKRRMWNIVSHHRENPDEFPQPTFAELSDMVLVSRVGADNLLMEFETSEGGRGKTTTLLAQIEKQAADHGAELIVLDSLHDLFGGNEINRVQVRQFINALQRIALAQNCAIVLNGHPSKSGLKDGDGSSGSTAWNNSVRSRLYLAREKAHEEERPPFTGPLTLRIMKANYAAAGTHIELEWRYGFMVPKNLPANNGGSFDKKNQVDRAFMACMEEAYKQNRPPQYAHNSKHPAPKMFAQMPCSGGFSSRDFKEAMERLLNAKEIEIISAPDGKRNTVQVLIPVRKKNLPDEWEKIPDVE